MSNNLYNIPDELTKTFNETPYELSPYHAVFKQWWNRGVDGVKQDNSVTKTKSLTSGLAELITLREELKRMTKAVLTTVRVKREEFVKRIEEQAEAPCPELYDIWCQSQGNIHQAITQSLKLLNGSVPEEPDAPFTEAERLMHLVKGIQRELHKAERLYAKYLGLAKLLNFYWQYDQLNYFDEARAAQPVVSEEGILNYSIKELMDDGHRDDHAARIRFIYYRKEENMKVDESFKAVKQELEQIRPGMSYILPDSVSSFNKTSKDYVDDLVAMQQR